MTAEPVNLGQPQMLMLQSVGIGGLQLTQKLCSGDGFSQHRAHRHRVDEQAHQGFHPRQLRRTTRDRGPKHHITLTTKRTDHPRPAGLHHNIEGGVM